MAGGLGPGGVLHPPHTRQGEIRSNVTLRWWVATWGQAPQNCADKTLPCLLSGAFCWHVRKQGSGSVHSRCSGSGAWSQKSRRGVGCSLEASFLECRCCLLTMSSRGCPCTCLGPNRLFLKGHQSDWTRAPEGPQYRFFFSSGTMGTSHSRGSLSTQLTALCSQCSE